MILGDKKNHYSVHLNCVAETSCFSHSSVTLPESTYDVLIPHSYRNSVFTPPFMS